MAAKKKTKKEGMPLWLCNTIIIALAALLVLGCTFQILNSTGVIASVRLHSQKAMESENYTMTGADLTYFTYLQYNNAVSYYSQMYGSQYLAYFGIDTSLPLSQQPYGANATWRDYCASTASETVKQYLVLCEAAGRAGVTLDDEDWAAIEASLQSLKDTAKLYGMSVNKFIASNYGKGVNIKDLKKCYEIASLADKYYQIIYDGFEYTTEDLQGYYDEHKKDFDVVDYRSYTFKAEYEKNATDEEKADAIEKAKADAEDFLKRLEDGEDFVDLAFEIELAKQQAEKDKDKDKDKETATGEPETTAAAETPETETPAATKDEADAASAGTVTAEPETGAVTGDDKTATAEPDTKEPGTEEDDTVTREDVEKSTLTKNATYKEGDLGDWLFGDEAAEVGDFKKIDSEESFTVYQVVTSQHRNDYNTVNVGHVYFYSSDSKVDNEKLKEEADKFLADFKKGEMTVERLEEMVKSGDYEYAVYNGELEKVSKVGDDVTDGWLFDEERKEKDAEVLESEMNGVNLFLYLGENDAYWEIQVDSAKRAEDYQAKYEELAAEFSVTVNEKVMSKIAA